MKTVVITGGARGIGAALVEFFYNNDYQVFYSYKNHPGLSKLHVHPFKADCSSEEGVLAFFSFITQKKCFIDCLINNVGIAKFNLLAASNAEQFDEIFNTNLKSAWLCFKHLESLLIPEASIINILSIALKQVKKGNGLYASSKAAFLELSKTMRLETSLKKIRIYDLIPGFVLTEALSSPFYQGLRENHLKEIPLERFARPVEIAEAAYHLSENGFGLEEAEILITGGQHLRSII